MIPWSSSEYGFEKTVEECEDLECITSWSGRRRSRECRSGDSHLEWPPMIMGFIHARNVCQKKVITFSWLWEEEEARLIRRRRKMGANWRSSYHHSKKIHQAMRNMKNSILDKPLIHLIIWIRNDDKEEWSIWILPTKQIKDKYLIVISWYCFTFDYI